MELWPLNYEQYSIQKWFPIKWHFTFCRCLTQMSMSKTTSLFSPKSPSYGFKPNLNVYLFQIITL